MEPKFDVSFRHVPRELWVTAQKQCNWITVKTGKLMELRDVLVIQRRLGEALIKHWIDDGPHLMRGELDNLLDPALIKRLPTREKKDDSRQVQMFEEK